MQAIIITIIITIPSQKYSHSQSSKALLIFTISTTPIFRLNSPLLLSLTSSSSPTPPSLSLPFPRNFPRNPEISSRGDGLLDLLKSCDHGLVGLGPNEELGYEGDVFASSNSAGDIGREMVTTCLMVVVNSASDSVVIGEGDLVSRAWFWAGTGTTGTDTGGRGFGGASVRRLRRVLKRRRGPVDFVILFGPGAATMAVTRGIFLRSRAVGSSVRGWRVEDVGARTGRKLPSFRRPLVLRAGRRGLPRESFRCRVCDWSWGKDGLSLRMSTSL